MQQKTQVVDEKDNVIGHKARSEVDYQADIYRVSALWLTNSKGDVLLAQRKKSKDKDPGKWGPSVSGTLEEGETYESNIYKEAGEEIGLHGVQFQLGPKKRVRSPRNFFCQWYKVTLNKEVKDFSIQEDEVEEIAWVSQDELVREVKVNPDKYIAIMPELIKILIPLGS